MQIYVCVKHVPDSAANIAIVDGCRIDENIAFLLNPFDEHAVTQAALLKSQYPDSEIITVCLGRPDAEKTLRSAMAMGADRSILIRTEAPCDPQTTARALKAAILADGSPDLILMGKESIDGEGMQTMFRLGVLMDMPAAVNVVELEPDPDGGTARAVYELAGGARQTCEMTLPCIAAAGRGLNTPIYPTFPQVVKSRKKPVEVVELDGLELEATGRSSTSIVALEPLAQDRSPQPLTGEPSQIADRIVTILKEEAKVL